MWSKWGRSHQCEQDTRLHLGQHISNLWRKAFIRADNLSGISLALQKYQRKSCTLTGALMNDKKWPLRRDFLMKSRSSGGGRQTDSVNVNRRENESPIICANRTSKGLWEGTPELSYVLSGVDKQHFKPTGRIKRRLFHLRYDFWAESTFLSDPSSSRNPYRRQALNAKAAVCQCLLNLMLVHTCMQHRTLLNIFCSCRSVRIYYHILIELSGKQIELRRQSEE